MLFSQWLAQQFVITPGVTAKAVADRAGISESYFSGLRHGRRQTPSDAAASQIARAFAQLRGLDAQATRELVDHARGLALDLQGAGRGPTADHGDDSGTRFAAFLNRMAVK